MFCFLVYQKVKQLCDSNKILVKIHDKRERFTKAVVLWSEWYEFQYERNERMEATKYQFEQEQKVEQGREFLQKMWDTDKNRFEHRGIYENRGA